MQLIITGIHQRSAPIAIRERVAFAGDRLAGALAALQQCASESLILSTCNRVEVYGMVPDGIGDTQVLRRFMAEWNDLTPDELLPHTFTLSGADAVRHVFRLAAGLDSMVLGEDQILAQIKAAMFDAQAAGSLGNLLNKLFQSALAAGKLVRTHTGISHYHLSVVSVAMDMARQTYGSLSGKRVLVIGAGRIAELAFKHLEDQPIAGRAIINRTAARAEALAARFGAQVWGCEQLEQALRASDVVISCTFAPHTVIDTALAERVLRARDTPLLLLDLAVPRDVDRQVAAVSGITLFDVDDMQAICTANRAARAAEVAKAEALIEGEVEKFMEWWASQQVVPTIKALREHAEAIRAAELERTLARMPDLSPKEQAAINALSAAIINKLLHQPISRLKDPQAGNDLALAVQQLFQL